MFEYVVQASHERIFFPKADTMIAVSREDVKFYGKFIEPGKIIFIPNLLEKSSYVLNDVKKEQLYYNVGQFYGISEFRRPGMVP